MMPLTSLWRWFSPRASSPIRKARPRRRLFLEALEDRFAPAAVLPPAGLISWYRAEGNANDFAAGNHGTLQGGSKARRWLFPATAVSPSAPTTRRRPKWQRP
jgi:hypothetical protein